MYERYLELDEILKYAISPAIVIRLINGQVVHNWTLLEEALQTGKTVNDILIQGLQATPIFYACLSAEADAYRYLETITDLNSIEAYTEYEGQYDYIRFEAHRYAIALLNKLIDSGADVNFKDISGATALIYAAQEAEEDYIDILLAAGADLSITDISGRAAWQAVTEKMPYFKDEQKRRLALSTRLKQIELDAIVDTPSEDDYGDNITVL